MPAKAIIVDGEVAEREAAPGEARLAWTDTRLVRECLKGDEDAWSALIEKYKRLIYSIPVKYGFNSDDANDIFQAVCLELLTELPKLRKPKALPKWLIQVASHKCFHRRRQQQRTEVPDEVEQQPEETVPSQTEGILQRSGRRTKAARRPLGAGSSLPPARRNAFFRGTREAV